MYLCRRRNYFVGEKELTTCSSSVVQQRVTNGKVSELSQQKPYLLVSSN
ncbi:hypothetical protein Tsubulata_032025 [Turnera subulata]|uniref:Uncharacterized protein n=1 Tax=Turnera subulata TaxID=218843 RepID=A0A9Q0F366_9ROSI|nr:hypothetical protein Tsubulata_032025 [Turnera subulata]